MICIEPALDHNTGIDTTTTGAAQDNLDQPTEVTATDLTMTHYTGHIVNDPNIKALQVIDPEIAVGHIHDHPINLQGMNLADQIYTPAG